MVAADRLASEVAPALARSASGVRAMLLEPPPMNPRRNGLHLHAWPQIELGWMRGADWMKRADDYGAEPEGRDDLGVLLLERGGSALLLCGGQATWLGADLTRWSGVAERSGCKSDDRAQRVGIVPSPAWTVQDVVERCVSLMPHVAGCDVLDAPPAGLSEVLAKLDAEGR
jgi:hypothetical protein